MSSPMTRLALVIDNLQQNTSRSVSSDAGGAVTSSQTAPPASGCEEIADALFEWERPELFEERGESKHLNRITYELECG